MKKPDRNVLTRMETSNEKNCRLFRQNSTGLGSRKLSLRMKHLFTDAATVSIKYLQILQMSINPLYLMLAQ